MQDPGVKQHNTPPPTPVGQPLPLPPAADHQPPSVTQPPWPAPPVTKPPAAARCAVEGRRLIRHADPVHTFSPRVFA